MSSYGPPLRRMRHSSAGSSSPVWTFPSSGPTRWGPHRNASKPPSEGSGNYVSSSSDGSDRSWAPPATLVSDWILEEDPGYDSEPDRVRP